MDRESYGLVANSLRARGFKRVRAKRAGAKAFRGKLNVKGASVGVRLEIWDWDFVSYPDIYIEARPESLQGFRMHVRTGGSLCYYMAGSIVLNRFKPAEAVARCLVRAQETLEEMACQGDVKFGLEDEFGFYWSEIPVYSGELDSTKRRARLVQVEGEGRGFHVLTQGAEEFKWIAHAIRGRVTGEIPVWLIPTDKYPSLDVQVGLPGTTHAAMNWVKRWDSVASQRLVSVLESKEYLEGGFAAFVFASPVGSFGFVIQINRARAAAYQRKPSQYRQYLYGAGGGTPISRLYGIDISTSFVHSRNLESKSLTGKRVFIIGCGAIGGYLAHSLVRLGAGVGAGGRLTLIDFDLVQPGNLGRHVLGFPALQLSKAEALRADLIAQFPYLNVVAHGGDVRGYSALFDNDLVVDATGEESLGIALAYAHQRHLARHDGPPMLHVWIAGNGEATQALLADGRKGGCFRCLWTDDPQIGMKGRIPLLKERPKTKFVGCQSVTLFPVSAAMAAAAVATDLVIDWLGGDPSPRFRTRARERANLFRANSQNLSRLKDCPACSKT